jgi:uncharacterized repeat protein (TIGR03806 family)
MILRLFLLAVMAIQSVVFLSSTAEAQTVSVSSVTIWNTATNTPVKELVNGDVINVATLPSFSLVANMSPSIVPSVVFSYGSNVNFNLENSFPYCIWGDKGGVVGRWNYGTLGSKTVVVRSFSQLNGLGTQTASRTYNFTIVNQPSGTISPSATPTRTSTRTATATLTAAQTISGTQTATFTPTVQVVQSATPTVVPGTPTQRPTAGVTSVESVTIWDTMRQTAVRTLQDGDVINVATLPSFSLVATMSPSRVPSVVWEYGGNVNYNLENSAPYCIRGDRSGVVNPWNYGTLGDKTIVVRSFSQLNGLGTQTASRTYTFRIVNQPSGTVTPTATSTRTPTPTPTRTGQPSETYGLDARPSNTTCLAPARTTGSNLFSVQRVFSSLSFNKAVKLVQAPGDATQFYVAEQGGLIKAFTNSPTASTTRVFLDLRSKVYNTARTGIMSMVFHPRWPTIPLVFVAYGGGVNSATAEQRLSSFTSVDGGLTLDTTTEQRILTLRQYGLQHVVDDLHFGSDKFLYISVGDGGFPPTDPTHPSQNLNVLDGKLLRIDIDGNTGSANYRIPTTNPFPTGRLCGANGPGAIACGEIYAYGLRNPWRFSIDTDVSPQRIHVADVGLNNIEEINEVNSGGNYGWNCREGLNTMLATCSQPAGSTLVDPWLQYTHSNGGFSVTGGFVYHGSAIPALENRYIFADYVTGNVWAIPTSSSARVVTSIDASVTNLNIVSFGVDLNKEIYLLDFAGGGIHKIVPPTGGSSSGGVATLLSQTGCVNPVNAKQPAPGVIPFESISPLWSDGAAKGRFFALPNGTTLSYNSDGDFIFPRGTVLVKDFKVNNKLIETRLFMLHPDGIWGGYSYRWNDQETDASLVPNGLTTTVQGVSWTYPSGAQCMACHTQAAGRSLGLEFKQLNSDMYYTQTNRTANQLGTLDHISMFNPALPGKPSTLPALVRPLGTSGTLSQRARSYLHSNCSHCHRPQGGTPVNLDLRYDMTLPQTNTCNQVPSVGDLGIANARIIAPGAPARSVLLSRINRRDEHQMPPLGTAVVDADAVTLISNWISSLPNCN